MALLLPLVGCRTRLLDYSTGQPPHMPPTSDPWPMAAHDPQLSNRGSTSGPSVPGVIWRSADFDISESCPGAQPLVARDGTVYVISDDGTLRAFSPADGQLRFESKLPVQGDFGAPSPATAAIGPDGTIYVGSSAPLGTTPIIAVDPQSGMPRWTSSLCRASLGFVGADGNVYGVCWPEGAAGVGTSMFSLRPEDGSLRFRTDAPMGAVSLLQGLDGTIVAVFQQNRGATFDPATGSLKLQLDLQANLETCLEVSTDGVLHCHDVNDQLDAMDIATGKNVWQSADPFIPGFDVWAEGNSGQLYVIQQDHIGVYDDAGTLATFGPTPIRNVSLPASLLLDGDGDVYLYGNTMHGTFLSVFKPWGAARFVTALDDQGWFAGGTLAIGDGTLYGVTCRQSAPGCTANPCHLVAYGSRP